MIIKGFRCREVVGGSDADGENIFRKRAGERAGSGQNVDGEMWIARRRDGSGAHGAPYKVNSGGGP
jgi:hypothetical protein